jgi:hypothetical protein
MKNIGKIALKSVYGLIDANKKDNSFEVFINKFFFYY